MALVAGEILLQMDPANAVLDPATTIAQEELPLLAFQNLTLAPRPIRPGYEMVGPAVKEPTSVQVSRLASLSARLSSLEQATLEHNSRLDKLRTDVNDIKQALVPPADSVVLACLVDRFLHKRGFSPLEPDQRKAWVQSKINELSQACGISLANIVEFMIVHASRVERGMLYSFPSNTVARAITSSKIASASE
ncbi:uncharacterized protein LACBIDRAFT_293600 [Laccaria bicolor S238N-H82]|uniref:Predicted protein n=1 Tax=Laccaria bicolor (strain S238N-H82 / ATCC MYA-4686) TaxID=486041 RepID=B0D4I9_LACBS|nr:uncharacterized protein LACBIDRAFT_293600 [Laccaria bicolor S238N-H82]EDR10570.1 predicted protein [Laccaria bicolor S238N-H82]|eukprot:XP_001879020.1 predicted protein [Laccaria bicolor S238N-H82]